MSDKESRTVRDYELNDVVNAERPDQMKALGDPLRMAICNLVLERAMSVTELAERVGRPKGTVAYHVDVLVDAGLLKVIRTRKVRAIEERFYGRVARTIVYTQATDELPFIGAVLAEVDLDRMRAGKLSPSSGSTTYRRARIPADRLAEYSRRLDELAIEFVDEPRGGDTEFGLYLALFPTKNPPHGDERKQGG